MVKIKQLDGSEEDFDAAKLEKSITAAGASEDEAKSIASLVGRQVVDKTSTYQIRLWVVTDLLRINPDAANKYSKAVSGMR